jgi:hypothetical protein
MRPLAEAAAPFAAVAAAAGEAGCSLLLHSLDGPFAYACKPATPLPADANRSLCGEVDLRCYIGCSKSCMRQWATRALPVKMRLASGAASLGARYGPAFANRAPLRRYRCGKWGGPARGPEMHAGGAGLHAGGGGGQLQTTGRRQPDRWHAKARPRLSLCRRHAARSAARDRRHRGGRERAAAAGAHAARERAERAEQPQAAEQQRERDGRPAGQQLGAAELRLQQAQGEPARQPAGVLWWVGKEGDAFSGAAVRALAGWVEGRAAPARHTRSPAAPAARSPAALPGPRRSGRRGVPGVLAAAAQWVGGCSRVCTDEVGGRRHEADCAARSGVRTIGRARSTAGPRRSTAREAERLRRRIPKPFCYNPLRPP